MKPVPKDLTKTIMECIPAFIGVETDCLIASSIHLRNSSAFQQSKAVFTKIISRIGVATQVFFCLTLFAVLPYSNL